MSNKDIKRLKDLAKKRLKEGVTKERALQTFVSAGILNEQGQFTKAYSTLASVTE